MHRRTQHALVCFPRPGRSLLFTPRPCQPPTPIGPTTHCRRRRRHRPSRHQSLFNIFHLFSTCYLLVHSTAAVWSSLVRASPIFLDDKHLSLNEVVIIVDSLIPATVMMPRATSFLHLPQILFAASLQLIKNLALLLNLVAVARC